MVLPGDIVKLWPCEKYDSLFQWKDFDLVVNHLSQFYLNQRPSIASITMRRLPICAEIDVIEMTTNQNLEVCQESRIERMRKLLSSPLTKKKSSIQGKMFGSALDVLAQREATHPEVPFIITRICQYIEKNGMTHEGIFRISGNARLIEKLKSSFDHTGDAPLETEGDVASAGALLKLFLRELPEPVIPSSTQAAFLEAARENFQNKDNCVRVLKLLVRHLPEEHYAVLKYLIHFLHRIAELEDQNRMSASSLGIVFGPNLFRVSDDFSGLKDQAVTNHIATTFIKNYESIFEDNSNELLDEELLCTRIDAKEYTPLSVLIPPMDDTVLAMQAQGDIQSEKRVPVLMVDSFGDGVKRGSVSGDKHPISTESPPRRKRKERKFSGDDISGPLRSSSEERPSMEQTDEQQFYLGGERIRRCSSHDEMRNIDEMPGPEPTANNGHKQTRRKSSAEVVGVNLTLSADGLSIATINQELSPHPPKPKRRELESSSHHSGSSSCSSIEPQSDQDQPNNNNQSSSTLVDHHDIHEMQRSAERLAPFQRGHNPRTRRTSSRSSRFRKSQSLESDEEIQSSADEKLWKKSQNKQWKSKGSATEFDSPMDTRAPGDENQEGGSSSSRSSDRHSFAKPHCKKYHRSSERKDSDGKPSHPLGELPPDDQLLYGSVSRRESLDNQEDWKTESFPSIGDDDSSIPHLDLNTLHEHGDGDEPIPSEHRFSWPLAKPPQDDTALLSPSAPYMRKANSYEAPQSPSAYKNFFSHRSSLQFDPSLPPSPPVEQDDLMKSTMKEDEAVAANVKSLTKKMHSHKKKIKLFEEVFESEHGYRPSHAEKMNYPEAKKILQEFNRIRKELRQLKEEGHTGELMSPHKEYPAMKTHRMGEPQSSSKPTVEDSLNRAQQYLSDNRKLHQRPEEFENMSKDQVQEEKIAIQKALLQFESMHGRPSTKVDRDTMRDLYERYRSVKRLVRANAVQSGGGAVGSSGSMKSKEIVMIGTELQPILEHVAMDFTSPQHRRLPEEQGKGLESGIDEEQENIAQAVATAMEQEKDLGKSAIASGGSEKDPKKSCNLHELPLSELLRQLQQARLEKRRLKKAVREFEEEFQRRTGRRAQKEDRSSVETIYLDYKHIKARLKLLDALVTKHEHHMMI